MPYPLWSWIQPEDMDSPLGMRRSVNLAKIIYQGEQNIFADIDDARLQRVVNEKVFHPSFHSHNDFVILSSQMYLPVFKQKNMEQFMLQNNLKTFRQNEDYISLDNLVFNLNRDDLKPSDCKRFDEAMLFLSLQSRISFALTVNLSLDEIYASNLSLSAAMSSVSAILRKTVIWLQNCLRYTNIDDVYTCLEERLNSMITIISQCSYQKLLKE